MDRSPTCSIGLAVLLFLGAASGTARADASRIDVAQGEIRIPSDADLERLERQGMATPPLEAGRQTTRQPGAAMSEQRREEIETASSLRATVSARLDGRRGFPSDAP